MLGQNGQGVDGQLYDVGGHYQRGGGGLLSAVSVKDASMLLVKWAVYYASLQVGVSRDCEAGGID